jgi:20S proteasome alpha/beta subunit
MQECMSCMCAWREHCSEPTPRKPPRHAESGGVRPFGVSLLLAGYDDNGPQLYQIDPSGSYFAWKASAIGKNMNNAKTFLEKRYSDEVREAEGGGVAGAAV